MSLFKRILPGLTLLFAVSSAAAQNVDHYEVGPSALRAAGGPPIYPSGVIDPSRANPPGPPPESAIPMPPVPGASLPTTPMGSPVWSPSGPASPSNSAPASAGAGALNSPPAAQVQAYPSVAAMPAVGTPTQSSWYTRVEYFHWNERLGSADFVNEDGTLFTVGYSRQIGIERFRAELFGGDVHYEGYDQANMASMPSNTGYLGLRGEYEMVLAPVLAEGRFDFLAGLGSRFWIRDLHDGTDDQGNPVMGYQETWWTIYPYLGLETHLHVGSDLELYSESRIGATALTYQFASINYRPLWPKAGVLANTEIGLRGQRFFIAGRAEIMTWEESSVVQDSLQPRSRMVTAGGRFGFTF
jgi:hypothetical protein